MNKTTFDPGPGWKGQRFYEAGLRDGQQQPTPNAPVPPSLAQKAYVAFVQICKGGSDDAGTYSEDEALVRQALSRLNELETVAEWHTPPTQEHQ
jgi:hypothetical protein